jgi:two-component system response regulator MprA
MERSTEDNVLLVDDEPAVRDGVGQALESAGYRVARCGNGEEAVSWLRHHPVPDILIGDVHMPGIGGFELGGRAHAMYESLPVLLITGDPYVGATPGDGPVLGPLLRKPFTRGDLLDAVAGLIAEARSAPAVRRSSARSRR